MEEWLISFTGAKNITGRALAGMNIGLLGGAFNPAHEGHVKMSLYALKALSLDLVLWLVAADHPIKKSHKIPALKERLEYANKLTSSYPRIIVTGLEETLNTTYTIDTLTKMRKIFPKANFVWLMGADNLLQMPEWQGWRGIFKLMPIAVFSREPYSSSLDNCEVMNTFKDSLVDEDKAINLAQLTPPRWTILKNPLVNISSTAIREASEKQK